MSRDPLHDPEIPSIDQPSDTPQEIDHPKLSLSEIEDEALPRKKVNIFLVLPHIALVTLLVIYLLLGGAVFQGLQLPTETKQRSQAVKQLKTEEMDIGQTLWNLTRNSSMREGEFLEFVKTHLKSVENSAVRVAKLEAKVPGDESQPIWSYSRSVFFAWTVITTIGNSRIVDLTNQGRVLAVIFALLGIPLLLITVADVGKILSDALTCVYARVRSKVKRPKGGYDVAKKGELLSGCGAEDEGEYTTLPWCVILAFLALYILIGGGILMALEGWSYSESCYFSFVMLAAIGFGDYLPKRDWHVFLLVVYTFCGLCAAVMFADLLGIQYIRKIHVIGRLVGKARKAAGVKKAAKPAATTS